MESYSHKPHSSGPQRAQSALDHRDQTVDWGSLSTYVYTESCNFFLQVPLKHWDFTKLSLMSFTLAL